MSENLNVGQILSIAKKLVDKCENGDEFLLGNVYSQIRQAYDKFPEDTVIKQMAFVFEKMLEKNAPYTIVSQKQISSIYNDLVRLSGENKFRTVLGHLLLSSPEIKKSTSISHDEEKYISMDDLVDPKVKNILESTFDNDLASKAYNKEVANKGISYIKTELKSMGFNTATVKIADGNANKIFYSTTFDTLKGPLSVYIPIKISNNKFIFPDTFIDDLGEQPLNKKSLTESFERRVIGSINKTANEPNLINPSSVDLPPLPTQKVEVPKELAHLTKDFENKILESTSSFGKEAIDSGKKIISSELRLSGFKNAQVKYGSDSNDSVVYLASINTPYGTSEIEIPLEMKATIDDKYIPMPPTCFAYNETIKEFTSQNLQKFALESVGNTSNNTTYAFMTLSELKEEMIKCASASDYNACEEILNQVGETFTDEDYKNAIADYQYILSIKSKAEENADNIRELTKSGTFISAGKGSIYPRMANGKKIKDLVRDESGKLRNSDELIKEHLNPIDNGGCLISTSKIFLT